MGLDIVFDGKNKQADLDLECSSGLDQVSVLYRVNISNDMCY